VGDRWSLIIVRDLALRGKSSYGDLLKSEEKIATNILASRLLTLENNGIIQKKPDPADRRKDRYSLTERGLALLPVLLELLVWGSAFFAESQSPKWLVAKARNDRNALAETIRSGISEGKFILAAA
jgi:DNA-binding HxlR family transcriptional regulator